MTLTSRLLPAPQKLSRRRTRGPTRVCSNNVETHSCKPICNFRSQSLTETQQRPAAVLTMLTVNFSTAVAAAAATTGQRPADDHFAMTSPQLAARTARLDPSLSLPVSSSDAGNRPHSTASSALRGSCTRRVQRQPTATNSDKPFHQLVVQPCSAHTRNTCRSLQVEQSVNHQATVVTASSNDRRHCPLISGWRSGTASNG